MKMLLVVLVLMILAGCKPSQRPTADPEKINYTKGDLKSLGAGW